MPNIVPNTKVQGISEKSNKRLLLNDPDVMTQMKQMQTSLQTLTHKVSQLESERTTLTLNVSQLESERTNQHILSQKISQLESTLAKQQSIKVGYTAGQHYNGYSARFGGPSNFLCLPSDPELANITTDTSSEIFGTEYEQRLLKNDAVNEDAPCAVCKSVNTMASIMIPGRRTCYSGWKKEYEGYLASDHKGYSASSYICLDKDIEYVSGGQDDKNGRLLYFTRTKCGSLSCPPYKDDLMVHCVVCSN